MKKLVHGSTFSGIGAPEVASAMLGWRNAFHCEINPFGRAVLDYHFPEAESYEDITKQDFSKWRGKIDVLTGGFPCQPFSYAGKRRGTEDDRYLWPFMLKCIKQIRPTWFVGENVAGIRTMVFPVEAVKVASGGTLFDTQDYLERNQKYVIEEICEQLEREGYSVQPMLIPACAVGAPHRRDRIFFIAHRLDADTSGDGGRTQEESCGIKSDGSNEIFEQSKRRESTKRNNGLSSFQGTPTDTDGRGGRKIHAKMEPEKPNGTESVSNGGESYSTANYSRDEYLLPENRWSTFPSVPLAYRGNDGFPFDVDRLTIPFNKWKTESIKAYGNAIVVQVIYRIFQAIDAIENGGE